MEVKGEDINMGPWSMYECMVFEGIIEYHLDESIPLTTNSLYTSYSQIYDVLEQCHDLQLPLGKKTKRQIQSKLARHYNVLSVFQTLFCQQVSINVYNSP